MLKLKWGELVDRSRVPKFDKMTVVYEDKNFSGRLFVVAQNGEILLPKKPYPVPWFGAHRVTFGYIAVTPMQIGILSNDLRSSDDIPFDLSVEMIVQAKDDGLKRIARERESLDEIFQMIGRSFSTSFFKQFDFAQIRSKQPTIMARFQSELKDSLESALPYAISNLLVGEIMADQDVDEPFDFLAKSIARQPVEQKTARLRADAAKHDANLRSEITTSEIEAQRLVDKAIAKISLDEEMQSIQDETALSDERREKRLRSTERFSAREYAYERNTALFAEEIKLIAAKGDTEVVLTMAMAKLLEKQREQEGRINLIDHLVSKLSKIPAGESSITYATAIALLGAGDNPDVLERALRGQFETTELKTNMTIEAARLAALLEREKDHAEHYRSLFQSVGSVLNPAGSKPINVYNLTGQNETDQADETD
tara:strand:- start:492 stop:1769 length:1278 start_codon:yes stop_codon:yes gene_type:complete